MTDAATGRLIETRELNSMTVKMTTGTTPRLKSKKAKEAAASLLSEQKEKEKEKDRLKVAAGQKKVVKVSRGAVANDGGTLPGVIPKQQGMKSHSCNWCTF